MKQRNRKPTKAQFDKQVADKTALIRYSNSQIKQIALKDLERQCVTNYTNAILHKLTEGLSLINEYLYDFNKRNNRDNRRKDTD